MKRLRFLPLLALLGLAIGIGFGWLMVQVWHLSETLFWIVALAALGVETVHLLRRRRRRTV